MGYSRDELIGHLFTDVTHPDHLDRDLELFRRQVKGELPVYTIEKQHTRGDGSLRWARVSSAAVRDAAGRFLYAIRVIEDITERKQAEERQRLLTRELSHRMKNALATVRALAFLFLHQDQPLEVAREQFETRLSALSQTHDLLIKGSWKGASLEDVLATELGPYASEGSPRFVANGPEVWLSPRAVLALGMVFHELATNAVKYGSLSAPQGRVEVTWRKGQADGSEVLELEWRELGGPSVSSPGRKGFGSRLIDQTVTRELSGRIRFEFEPSGLRCVLEIPVTEGLTATDQQPA
jgi:PAS domain S-box-containing protein